MKQARTAEASGTFGAVHVIAKAGHGDADLPSHERHGASITLERITVPRLASGLNFLLWCSRALRASARMRPRVISVHDVMLLPVGALSKWLTGARLVYDTHELETESASVVNRPFSKAMVKLIEFLFLRAADQVIVVNDAIADWYRRHHPRATIAAIHNYPNAADPPPSRLPERDLRRLHNIPDDKTLFIYQGALTFGRGIPLLLELFTSGAVSRGAIVFMGFGEFENDIRAAAARNTSVCFQPAVPQEEIVHFTSSADVGVVMGEPICLSYELSLPNKFFEYLQAGLPVIVTDALPLMARLTHKLGVGETAKLTLHGMARAFNAMIEADRTAARDCALRAAKTFTWEHEEPRLKAIYAKLGKRAPTRPLAAYP